MDEYDELFEMEEHFNEQYADELEVLAEMDGEWETNYIIERATGQCFHSDNEDPRVNPSW